VSITFEVPFVAGKQRPRWGRNGHMYTPEQTRRAERDILGAFRVACPQSASWPVWPKGTPLAVHIDVYQPMPKSRPKRLTSEPNTYKPDVDNVAKAVLDALNGAAWVDDAQVVQLCVSKSPREREGSCKTRVWIDALEKETEE